MHVYLSPGHWLRVDLGVLADVYATSPRATLGGQASAHTVALAPRNDAIPVGASFLGRSLVLRRDDLRRLAERPNVACKFSGLASCCDAMRPMTPQVRPYFEHCLECFTPARLMWGSDWPVCNLTFDLGAWLRTTAELPGELSPEEQTAMGTGTAQRIYRLAPQAGD